MRFLFITPGFPGLDGVQEGSGIGTYVREITLGLVARGHETDILTWRQGPPQRVPPFRSLAAEPRMEVWGHVRVHAMDHGYWPLFEQVMPESCDILTLERTLRRLLAGERYDGIEFQHDERCSPALLRAMGPDASLRIHTTLIQMVETKEVKRSWKVNRRLARERRTLEASRHHCTNSRFHSRELQRRFPGLKGLRVVPHGLDIDAAPSAGSVPASQPRFLVVVSPDRRKGVDRIRPTFERYIADYGPCRVTVVSRVEPMRRLLNLDGGLPEGLSMDVVEPVTRDSMLQVYATHNVLFHPARYESFGLTLVEAAAMCMPVVATAVGIAPDLMDGELARFLVDAADPAACAARLHDAWTDRKRLGREFRRRYEGGYTRHHMTDAFLLAVVAMRQDPVRGVDPAP